MTSPGAVKKAFDDAAFWLSLPMNRPIVQLIAILLTDMQELKTRLEELESRKG